MKRLLEHRGKKYTMTHQFGFFILRGNSKDVVIGLSDKDVHNYFHAECVFRRMIDLSIKKDDIDIEC